MSRGAKLKIGLACGVIVAAAVAGYRYAPDGSNLQDLRIEYGAQGIERLSYRGAVLEDLARYPSDTFHIWHIKMTGLDGRARTEGQYGWGENNIGRSWDGAAHTWTYLFPWGSIRVQFVQSGNELAMNVTEKNNAESGVILDGAAIYPFVLHLPRIPEGFSDGGTAHLAFDSDGPSVTIADYGKGEIAAVVPDAARPLYSGFLSGEQPRTYTPVISGTALDQMPAFQPHFDRPVAPGETDRFTVALRFAPSGTGAASLARDVYAGWAQAWPAQLHWPDRRMIGTIYLASSPAAADAGRPAGYANNPRRYFNDAEPADFDLRTPGGMSRFQQRVLKQARDSVAILRRLGAQGAITWDIEGEQYPQETSYVCAPDQIGRVAPEMESVIDEALPYAGLKLADGWFKTFRDAGFRVGVCVRPQRFVLGPDGMARQVQVTDVEAVEELVRKMRYAHDRWGATLFYLDSTVGRDGAALSAATLQKVAAALPDSLLIPEETVVKDYAYTAPFKSFLFHGDLGTDAAVRRFYPQAFSVNLVNDADAGKLGAAREALTQSVRGGDILMPHADYWHQNNEVLAQIYDEAKQLQ